MGESRKIRDMGRPNAQRSHGVGLPGASRCVEIRPKNFACAPENGGDMADAHLERSPNAHSSAHAIVDTHPGKFDIAYPSARGTVDIHPKIIVIAHTIALTVVDIHLMDFDSRLGRPKSRSADWDIVAKFTNESNIGTLDPSFSIPRPHSQGDSYENGGTPPLCEGALQSYEGAQKKVIRGELPSAQNVQDHARQALHAPFYLYRSTPLPASTERDI